MNTFYFTFLIFLVISPQAFSNGRCSNSFSKKPKIEKTDKQEREHLLAYPISGFRLSSKIQRILESNNIHLLVDLVRTTEFELLQLSEPRLVHFGDIGVPHGKMVTFKSVNLITVKALLSAMGFHLGMTEVAPWSDQKRNRRIEAYQSNRELPPVLVRRIITQRQEKILRMRWGIGEERPHLLREVALLFNLSTGKIQRMEASAHSKFSNYIRKKLKWEDAIPEGNGEKWREWIEKLIEMQNNVPILFPESQ